MNLSSTVLPAKVDDGAYNLRANKPKDPLVVGACGFVVVVLLRVYHIIDT